MAALTRAIAALTRAEAVLLPASLSSSTTFSVFFDAQGEKRATLSLNSAM
jgi:hypothetical protein